MTENDGFHVLIIGAGSAGRLMAQALKKQGIRSTVFEQDAAIDARPRDWNFGLYWAQSPLAECLPDKLSALVESVQVDSRLPSPDEALHIYNGESRELLKALPTPMSLRLQRRKFLQLISSGIDIQYDKRMVKCYSDGQTVKVHFEDGTEAEGNLLIGADGAHSKIREHMVGKERAQPTPSPIVATTTMARLPRHAAIEFSKMHPRSLSAFHPNGTFTWFGVHDALHGTEPGQWTFMINTTWISEEHDVSALQGERILTDLKQKGSAFGAPFNLLFDSIPDGTKCWHNRLSYWIPQPWDNFNNTMTLIGDAAHPMTFHRGQGLNNAIHDVASLARCIKEAKLVELGAASRAITAYEQEMCPRGKEAVEASNQNSLAVHDWTSLRQSPLFTHSMVQKVPGESKDEASKPIKI